MDVFSYMDRIGNTVAAYAISFQGVLRSFQRNIRALQLS
jgi:hypothetical protein